MRILKGLSIAVISAGMAIAHLDAVTRVPSADGQFWDIQDTSAWSQDSGGIATGGRSNPFNGFGYLKMTAEDMVKLGNLYLGTQGDEWDAQKDMTAALAGALLALFFTRAFGAVPLMESPLFRKSA